MIKMKKKLISPLPITTGNRITYNDHDHRTPTVTM